MPGVAPGYEWGLKETLPAAVRTRAAPASLLAVCLGVMPVYECGLRETPPAEVRARAQPASLLIGMPGGYAWLWVLFGGDTACCGEGAGAARVLASCMPGVVPGYECGLKETPPAAVRARAQPASLLVVCLGVMPGYECCLCVPGGGAWLWVGFEGNTACGGEGAGAVRVLCCLYTWRVCLVMGGV